jgi:exonuclease VII small subunit
MFNLGVQSKTKPAEKVVTSARRSKPEPVGRERLKHLDAETQKAKEAVVEFEQRVQRLESIIADAETAHKALQQAIAADGGKALEDYASGLTKDDDEISKLVMTAENSARAATAAKAALPVAQAALDNVRAQVVVLGEERVAELNRVIAMMADSEARSYQRSFDEMCRRHDRLVGYASVAQMSHGDIQLIIDPVKAPRFAFPSMGTIESDPFLRHQVSSLTVSEAAKQWTEVRARLEADVNADVSDLIGGVK